MSPRRAAAGLVLCLLACAPVRAEERLTARGDAVVDLVAAVQRLAGDGGFGLLGATTPLGREGLRRLRAARNLPAVALTRELAARGFSGRFPLQYALYLSSAPGLPERLPPPELFPKTAGGPRALSRWRAALDAFQRSMGFFAWRDSRAADFDALAARARAAARGRPLERGAADFLGLRPWRRFEVLTSPFVVPDRGAWWVLEDGPRPTIVAVLGPHRFGAPFGRPESFAEDVWGEALFSAGYIAVEACRDRLRWSPKVCDGLAGLDQPEDCAERLWVDAALPLLKERTFGSGRAPRRVRRRPLYPATAAALRSFAARADGDWLSWAPRLLAPLTADGRAPECPLPDPARAGDPLYERLVGAALLGRLERGPDPAAAALLRRLRPAAP